VDAFMCYKQKCKVVSLNLAHPVYVNSQQIIPQSPSPSTCQYKKRNSRKPRNPLTVTKSTAYLARSTTKKRNPRNPHTYYEIHLYIAKTN